MASATETIAPPANPTSNGKETDPYEAARASLQRDGFVVLPASLFPSFDLDTLRAAAKRSTDAGRSGKWPYIRTLPKQFPPWPSDPSHGIWGIQHLLHPQNPDHPTFLRSYFDGELLRYAQTLIGCGPNDLVLELYNMLVRPDAAFQLRWHRDDIPAGATPAEEMARLGKKAAHAQWNLALYDDASLVVIPGSHARARTEIERGADPYAAELPGQMVVRLRAGEVVFYDNNVLHRGVYDPEVERATLHGSVGCVGAGSQRARNVLQHGVAGWVEGWDVEGEGGLEPEMVERIRGMRDRLLEMAGREGDVGFFAGDE